MQILARLYDLLSQASEKDLREAAKLAGEESDLTDVILMLARFKRVSGRARAGRVGSSPRLKKSTVSSKSSNHRSVFPSNGAARKLAEVILSKEYFPTNRELAKYLKNAGVPFSVNAKDSRKRVFNKIVNWLNKLPHERQRKAYMELLRVLPPSETAGWFDAIRSSRS